jgi:predicted MFS family arabinose efflux permease
MGLAAALIMAIAGSLAVFVAGILLYSTTSFVNVPLNSYITAVRGPWSIQRAVSFVFGAMFLGTVAGPALGGWVGETMGLPIIYRFSVGIFLASTLMFLFLRQPPAVEATEPVEHARRPTTNPRFLGLLAVMFCTVMALFLPQPLTSIYLRDVHQLSIQEIGATGTFASLGSAVIMLLLGNLRAPVGVLVGHALVAGFIIFLWRGSSMAAFSIGYLFIGGYRLARTMALAYVRPLVRESELGLAYGFMETTNAAAAILAPVAASFLYNGHPERMYTVSLAAVIAMFCVHLFLTSKHWAESGLVQENRLS